MILNAENMQTSKYFLFWGKIAKQQEIFVVPLFFAILEHFNCGGIVIMIWYLSRCFYILCENFLKLTGRDYKKIVITIQQCGFGKCYYQSAFFLFYLTYKNNCEKVKCHTTMKYIAWNEKSKGQMWWKYAAFNSRVGIFVTK